MTRRMTRPLELIQFEKEPWSTLEEWLAATRELLGSGARPVMLFGQNKGDDCRLWAIFAPQSASQLCLTNTVFRSGEPRV